MGREQMQFDEERTEEREYLKNYLSHTQNTTDFKYTRLMLSLKRMWLFMTYFVINVLFEGWEFCLVLKITSKWAIEGNTVLRSWEGDTQNIM